MDLQCLHDDHDHDHGHDDGNVEYRGSVKIHPEMHQYSLKQTDEDHLTALHTLMMSDAQEKKHPVKGLMAEML